MLLIAILFPCVSFFLRGKIIQAIVCFFLQITIIGWLPAAFWAVSSRNEGKTKKQFEDLKNQIQNNQNK